MIRQRSILVIVAVLAVAAGLIVVGTRVYAQGPVQCPNGSGYPMGGMMGGRMMGGYGQVNPQCPYANGMMGGRMGGWMNGMMGGWMNASFGPGTGMMGAWTPPADLAPAGTALTLDKAAAIGKAYIAAWNSQTQLKLGEIMQFSNHFYGEAIEAETGRGAFEFLIDPANGIVYAEPGPNMMWNLRYSVMARYMGQSTVDGDKMTISAEQAVKSAQAYLDRALPGTKAEDDPLAFYGFYTLDFLRDGKIAGMLSVNGYTGQVWLHQWHGEFVAETSQQ